MNEVVTKEDIKVENMIYEIRGKQVMLDSDLARIYECANGTKTINQAVKRNINRFPDDFYFQIEAEEFLNLKSQIGTSSWNNYGGIRKLPYVFTEQGVSMLATVLKTKVATEVSIKIINAFVAMRKYISYNSLEQKYINDLALEHDKKIKTLENSLKKLIKKRNLMNKIEED